MSQATNDELLDMANEALDVSAVVSDVAAGTLIGDVIDAQRDLLRGAINANDLDMVRFTIRTLADVCTQAGEVFGEH